MQFVPVLARLLKGGTPPSARASQMLALLEAWRANGGSRLDRDLDGKIDDPGAAILDAAWNRLADAAMTPVLGKPLADQLIVTLHKRFDAPPGGQFDGWYQYMDKDLRDPDGREGARARSPTATAAGATSRRAGRRCGRRSRRPAWTSRRRRAPDPTAWRADATAERIKFLPGLLPFTMRYTNRPTGIQQVIEFNGHR